MQDVKNKLVKSYYLMGNLPIYNTDLNIGSHDPIGCDFVINTRLKYEIGICSMQFIKQKQPSIYNVDGFQPEIELDLSSLIRLKKRILYRESKIFLDDSYIHVTSTKLAQKTSLQKGAFVSYNSKDHILSITIDSKKQEIFYIKGLYQIECLAELIDLSITNLSKLYGEYDLKKQHVIGKDFNPIVPQQHIMNNTNGLANNVPPPVLDGHLYNAPKPVTKQVIVQAPPAPIIQK